MSKTVMLVGCVDQGNLGIGYLAATLIGRGYSVQIIDFRKGPEGILEAVKSAQPILIGFSLSFQYYLPGFAKLASHLRAHGVKCHFCIGGHYPSLCHEDVLTAMPELDSIVCCEGESALLELAESLVGGHNWRQILGLAYRQNGAVTATPRRPLIDDLDELPHPYRHSEPRQVLGRKFVPILASRGCARRCTFCSIHSFYRSAPGKVVRTRKPARVVQEMRTLHDEHGISIFLFWDDDFPLSGKRGRRWALELVDELHRYELPGRAIWKISCRAEHVEAELFSKLRAAGLYLVYLGLESGSEVSLKVLNKQTTVEENLRAVSVLKDLDVMFQYGLMLFDPASTFETIRENVAFLRRIVGDGSAAATFCRMLPYGGTPIREQLAREGRLRGDVTQPDYDFLDPRLNRYFESTDRAVGGWTRGEGASHQLDWAWHEVRVIERLFPPVAGLEEYKVFVRTITKASNDLLLRIVQESSLEWERGANACVLNEDHASACKEFVAQMLPRRNEFIERNQDVLLTALAG